jgi:hypothetical protein
MRVRQLLNPTLCLIVSVVSLPGVARADLLDIRAKIDGRSRLVLQGATAQWEHFDFAAPGRLECDLTLPIEPTWLGGVAWFPDWPDVPTCENRDCDCTSSTYVGLVPSLPPAEFAVTLHVVQARNVCQIVEQPSASNGWRVVIEFDDNPIGGHDWYEVRLEIDPWAPAPCAEWNLAADFRASPEHENPNRDACGVLGVWHFLGSDPLTYPARDPAGYALLPLHDADMFGTPGLESWQGTDGQGSGLPNLPWIGINATGTDQGVVGIEWPEAGAAVHPLWDRYAVVGWRSPWTGTVTVRGAVRDLDDTCASTTDGVEWFVDHWDGAVSSPIASGLVPDGGAQDFRAGAGGHALAELSVTAGDYLHFVVGARAGIGCDSTGIDVIVRPALAGVPFCTGDGLDPSHTTPCPCANEGAPGHGCGSSVNPAGALLEATGDVTLDDVVLLASGMPSTVSCIFLQGDALEDTLLTDGVRCAGGYLRRLRVRQNIQGSSAFPDATDSVSLSERGLVAVGSGAVRYYQVFYRNAAPTFCPAGASNLTNGWKIVW